jgi:hypothetical protein
MKINSGEGLDSCSLELRCDEDVVTESVIGKEFHLARHKLSLVHCKRFVEQQTTLSKETGGGMGVERRVRPERRQEEERVRGSET